MMTSKKTVLKDSSGLSLTRLPGEQIFIGDDIIITFIRVHGNETRVNIKAPRKIQIDRDRI